MALLPVPQNSTVVKMFQHWERNNGTFAPRPHLGASIIGNPCARALWYSFHWCTHQQFSGRMLRLFDTGNREEFRIVVDLRNAGVTVHDKDPTTQKQFQFFDHGGHFSGSMDACMLGLIEAPQTWHVGEFKTHNEKSFDDLVKRGVKLAKPLHWKQMNTYMGWSKMTRAMYIAVNKNTDQIYSERLEFDKVEFERDRAKAETVIRAPEPLSKISEKADWFECTFCDHRETCHEGKVPVPTCRTCAHSTAVIEEGNAAKWTCDKHNKVLTFGEQVAGCGDHLFIPVLLSFAQVQEAGEGWVAYRNKKNGSTFFNITDPKLVPPADPGMDGTRSYTSKELYACTNTAMIGDPFVGAFKEELGAEVVSGEMYLWFHPESDSYLRSPNDPSSGIDQCKNVTGIVFHEARAANQLTESA